ncbi:DUF1203 domain-containing protein [Sphingomonas xanthus]|uniref:DUF1203 domain-containing protein n=1 Tax=Sphingomonas xanthus TaxID=2594473 RepID=A0A516IPH2_9SPHN|nr:DUF1203 domain-containing protein [Sphingomonas xanthus]QDP18810.1 DUF1203 domain-containing protein [Sphingomonas xanthus]
MTYRFTGLAPSQFAHLIGSDEAALTARGAVRMIANGKAAFPCRIQLDDAVDGEPLLLVNHVSHGGNNPYRASHAIFVSETATEPVTFIGRIPPALDRRILSLRAFDGAGMMVDAMLAQPGEADPLVRGLLANANVDHVDAHTAIRGCFLARADRA